MKQAQKRLARNKQARELRWLIEGAVESAVIYVLDAATKQGVKNRRELCQYFAVAFPATVRLSLAYTLSLSSYEMLDIMAILWVRRGSRVLGATLLIGSGDTVLAGATVWVHVIDKTMDRRLGWLAGVDYSIQVGVCQDKLRKLKTRGEKTC